MHIDGTPYRTIFPDPDGVSVQVIDQTRLPFAFELRRLATLDDAALAIRTMIVRGAPLIGVTAAYGLALAMRADPSMEGIDRAVAALAATRPTAINLRWALDRVAGNLRQIQRPSASPAPSRRPAHRRGGCGELPLDRPHGGQIIADLHAANGGRPVTVLTHCNAGWLATVDWGTALAPIYAATSAACRSTCWWTRPAAQPGRGAHRLRAPRPRRAAHGDRRQCRRPLMQHGGVDLCIVGSDRTTASGDVCNKIGTY